MIEVAAARLRVRCLLAVLGFAGIFIGFTRRARAEVLVVLDYQVAPTVLNCPSAADFRQQVAAQIGHDPFRKSAPRRALVRLYMEGSHMAGHVEWRDANDQWEGERAFASRNEGCAQMTRSMALATAIQIELLEEQGAPAKPPEPKPPAAVPAPPSEAKPPAVVPPAIVENRPLSPSPTWSASPDELSIVVTAGAGVIRDRGDSPTFVVPRLAVSVARASISLRLAASAFGPGAGVSRPEGSAQLDRLLLTLAAVRFFRAARIVQPILAVGIGWQDVQVKGSSAMPSIAAAHDGHASAAVITVGGGVAFRLAPRLAVILEAEGLVYRPVVAVQVASSQAARFGGAALFTHGGLLARF